MDFVLSGLKVEFVVLLRLVGLLRGFDSKFSSLLVCLTRIPALTRIHNLNELRCPIAGLVDYKAARRANGKESAPPTVSDAEGRAFAQR